MTNQTTELLELVDVIKEQQELIAELLKYLPSNSLSEEMKTSIDRTVAATERIRANLADKAEVEKWAEERRTRLKRRGEK